jgi:putative ABC transport system permease protein
MSAANAGGSFALLLIVRRSLRQHALSTFVTALSAALAIGLTISVFSIKAQTYEAFTGGPVGFDAVLGARGSQLQLVLNTVFHLETSPGNIPWSMYRTIKANPQVELAIPYAVGDNYYGYRIVGTELELFEKFEYRKGEKFEVEPPGRVFDPALREAVVGSYVASKLGLGRGSKFKPFHGLGSQSTQHDEEYVVVGVLEPTNSPSDRVIWIPIEGIFRMGGHRLRGGGEDYAAAPGQAIPDEHKEVSAVMLKFRSEMAGMSLNQTINNQGKVATLAWPIGRVMAELFDKVGWMNRVMALVAYLVVFVAAGSILASLYNSMNERRREFAILRSLGARRRTVFSVIILESAAIAFMGSLGGLIVYGAIFTAAAQIVRAQTGVVLDLFYPHPVLLLGPIAMIALGALAGIAPAIKAYSTDVATNLTPVS